MKDESGFLTDKLAQIDANGLNLAGNLFDLSGLHLLLKVLKNLDGSETHDELGILGHKGEELFCFTRRKRLVGLHEHSVKVIKPEFCSGNLA
jgi:hypothetical protein